VILIGVESFFGGLIQAAVGSSGGLGARPLKRIGFAANAASSMTARQRPCRHHPYDAGPIVIELC
jgi:hypothetical protein